MWRRITIFRAIAAADLARALTGEVKNWQELGGPDKPIVLHALTADNSLQEALEARLGQPIAAKELHPDLASLATAVARDPWALAHHRALGAGAGAGFAADR